MTRYLHHDNSPLYRAVVIKRWAEMPGNVWSGVAETFRFGPYSSAGAAKAAVRMWLKPRWYDDPRVPAPESIHFWIEVTEPEWERVDGTVQTVDPSSADL